MAEGLSKSLMSNCFESFSAGIETKGLNPFAVQVLKEIGIDISHYRSKHVDELKGIQFDYVITLCGHANENCPYFSGATRVIHMGFDDPPILAEQFDNDEDKLNCYRQIRDQIREYVLTIPKSLI